MRDDACTDSGRGCDLMQCNSQIRAEPRAAARAGKEKTISGACILTAQLLKTMHDPADEGIDGDETLRPQLAKGHMNGPLILADTAQAVQRQIQTLADAHTGVPEKQQGVADPIVAPDQRLLNQLILLGAQRTRQTSVGARDVVSADKARQERYPFGPRQFFKDTAQPDDIVGVS